LEKMRFLPYWRLSGYYFFYFAFIGVFSPYFGLYLQSLRFSAWDIGLLMSQMLIMRLFGPVAWGWVSDNFGHRMAIIRLCSVFTLLGFTAFFWLRHLTGMLLAMAVLFFFWSATLPLVESLTLDHVQSRQNGYSNIRLWGSVGFIIAVMGTGVFLDYFLPVSVLWICWIFLAGLVSVTMTLPDYSRYSVPAPEKERSLWNILAQRRVWILFTACVAMSAAHGAFYIFYSIHLAEYGYSKMTIGGLWSLGIVAEIVIFMMMNRLTRRFSLRAILLVSLGTAILRFLLIGWGAQHIQILIFAQLMHGLTFASIHASSVAAVHAWFPASSRGRGQALYSSLSFGAGGLIGALISGLTWDIWGAGWTFTMGSGFALCGFCFILFGLPGDETHIEGMETMEKEKS
jgi:PPP family 3-phenylpropionic acid transporter